MNFISQNSGFGFIGTAGSLLFSMTAATPMLQFIGAIFTILIGILSVYGFVEKKVQVHREKKASKKVKDNG